MTPYIFIVAPEQNEPFLTFRLEELYDRDLTTNLTEKQMEKSCSLDTVNPYQPEVIELSSKNEV